MRQNFSWHRIPGNKEQWFPKKIGNKQVELYDFP